MTETTTPADEWADDLPHDWTATRRSRGWREHIATAATASIVLLPLGGAAGYAYGHTQQPDPVQVQVPVTPERCVAAVNDAVTAQLDKLAQR